MTGRQKGNGGPEKGRVPVSIALKSSSSSSSGAAALRDLLASFLSRAHRPMFLFSDYGLENRWVSAK
jgi:hypothetical protein